ncbi:MAG: hypothetical protein NTV51_22285 [Verrucomicrobia bacterium]|nr:hypothetical protein [Verrucomicrobiota bacterium]
MLIIRKQLETWRRQREAVAYAKAFHTESRARVAHLADSGQGQVALQENLSLLGIDPTKSERPRLVTIGGVRFSAKCSQTGQTKLPWR